MRHLWAPRVWIDGHWHDHVHLGIDGQGRWCDIKVGQSPASGAEILTAPVLPGIVNAHSHAFQRAFVGHAEQRGDVRDDFWSWRASMYAVANSISPEALEQVAMRLYRELLVGGYTHVCEFHYLHHRPDGGRYADPLTMIRPLVNAAMKTGIGLTVLPTLYERAGFSQPTLRQEQRRFAADADMVLNMCHGIDKLNIANVRAGVAIHSLRAATPESINQLVAALSGSDMPIHIHVAEQMNEVKDCIAVHGCGPIEWLVRHEYLDARWQLIHATHAQHDEIEAVVKQGAGVVICPTTEANLGDGIADVPAWLNANLSLAVGSDSQVTRAWPEELRWLEYVQRLTQQRRNIIAAPEKGKRDTAARLFDLVSVGGGRAAGFQRWGIAQGARADLLQIDMEDSLLAEVNDDYLLSALIFGSPAKTFSRVMVAGQWVI